MGQAELKTITLRNLPDTLARCIKQKSVEDRTSINRTVIGVLEQAFGLRRSGPTRNHDLDRFIGTWTREETAEFEEALREQRQIDPDLWK
jgi:hypothetical protein